MTECVLDVRAGAGECVPDVTEVDDDEGGKPSRAFLVGTVPIPLGGGMGDFMLATLFLFSPSFRLREPEDDPGICEFALPIDMGTVSRSQRSSSSPGVRVFGYGRRNTLSGD